MQGHMQNVPLSIPLLLARAVALGGSMEVVSVEPAGTDRRSWPEIGDRAARIGSVLDVLDVPQGAVVGSFAWNGHRHLELYYGVTCSRRVLHAVNVRLHEDTVEYVIRHAGDKVIFVDASLTPLLGRVRDRLDARVFVVMEDGAEIDPAFENDPRYEDLLASAEPLESATIDENEAASICFTSGTTGRPKAVVYSHRSVVLHSLAQLTVDGHGIRRGDVIMPLTPMFHVNCWGLPYTAGMAPASLVFTGSDTSPEAVARLIESERPTVVAGIPTFWVQMDSVFADGRYDLSSVERILCGGAEATPALVAKYTGRGIDFFHGWGMTEMSPSGTGNWIKANDPNPTEGAKQGVAAPLVEMQLVGDDGSSLPWDGETVGEIEVRGPWIAGSYLDPDDDSNEQMFREGWLRTGDVGRVEPDGTLVIVDRIKDLVKSGGEWVSSVELERILAAHPAVRESAVIAVPHQHWGERPAALVVVDDHTGVSEAEIRAFLSERVASWQVPDWIRFVEELPKTGVGKIDKRRLRDLYAEELAAGADHE